MSRTGARILHLPPTWYDRPQYRPRVEGPGGETWFAVSPALGLPRRLDDLTEPRALGTGPHHAALAECLRRTYAAWRIPLTSIARRSIEDVALGADSVVTGQQPGLLGGPLFTLYKALSALALARRLETARGRRCVAMFWVAGDDHDVDEIRTARCRIAPNGEAAFSLPIPSGRTPLSSIQIDSASREVIAAAVEHVRGLPFADDAAALAELYQGRSVAAGFAALVAALLGDEGLLVLDPEELRPLARPIVRRVVDDPAAALARVEEGAREAEARGLGPFVATRLPLFLLRDGRRDHLSPVDGGLAVDGGGPRLETAALHQILEDEPRRFSSGALLRPIVQESVIPGAVTVVGPSESGYFAQIGPLARWCGVAVPRTVLRLQATLLEADDGRAWTRLGLDAERFARAARPEDLAALPAGRDNAAPVAAEELDRLRSRVAALGAAAASSYPAERRALERSAAAAQAAIEKLEARVRLAHSRSDTERFAAALGLWHTAFPAGVLQERRWCAFFYLARYGRQWIQDLLEEAAARPVDLAHRLVFLGE